MPSISASGPPERRGEGRRPVGPSAFASVRLPRSRHRFVPAPASYLRRSRLCAEPYARRRLPRSFLARRRPGWGRKRLPLRGFLELIARSAASAPHALRHRLRSGPAPFRPRSVQAPSPQAPPEPSLRGAFTARSLCCAGAFARRAFAPPLAPIPNLPYSWLPSLRGAGAAAPEGRGAVTAVTEGCCHCIRSVCNFLLLPQFRAFFRHAAPPL